MSQFTQSLIRTGRTSDRGMVTGAAGRFTRRTWPEIHQMARRIAGALGRAGLGRGAKVAVLCGDPAEVAPLVQAIWLRGAAVTMVQQPSPRMDLRVWRDDTAAILSMVEANALVIGRPFAEDELMGAFRVRTLTFASLLDGDEAEPVTVDEQDAALLQLSSGSTGTPKAIVITHRNLYANVEAMIARFQLSATTDRLVSWLPLFHDMGMIAFLAQPMMAGFELIKSTPLEFLSSPTLWAELVSRFGGTFTSAPNFAYALLARRLGKVPDGHLDLSSVRYAINGAEPVDCLAMQRFVAEAKRFGWRDGALVGAYGLAEAVLAVSAPEPGSGLGVDVVDPAGVEVTGVAVPQQGGRPLAKLGAPLAGMEVRVLDDSGRPVPERRIGELVIRGAAVTKTYITAEGVFPAHEPDGWLRTGDLGYRTEDGQLVICGRKKDVIIVSGRNVYPTEIERAVEGVPGIRKGAVIAVSIDAGHPGEGFAVIAESASGSDGPEMEELRRSVGSKVFDAVGVAPRQTLIVSPGQVPKTSSGKLRRGHARLLLS